MIDAPTIEVPCIKCGMVDTKENFWPLTYWVNEQESVDMGQRFGHPSIVAWVHQDCWHEYNDAVMSLKALEVAAQQVRKRASQ